MDTTTQHTAPPSLPRAHAGTDAQRTQATVDADSLARLAARAGQHDLDLDAVLATAASAVIRTWADDPVFSLGVLNDAGMWSSTIDCTRGTFVQAAAAAAAAIAVGQHADRLPVVITLDPGSSLRYVPDLSICAVSTPQGLSVSWESAADTLAPAVTGQMANGFVELLELLSGTVAWEEVWMEELPRTLVPTADRELVAKTNDTTDVIPDVLLQDLLEQQCSARPDALAVVDARRRLTYGELGTYARRIGHRLVADGVGPGDLVAIVAEKGWEQLAAVYGILHAGAAYMPIDPSLPDQRIQSLLARGAVTHVLSQSWLLARCDRVHRGDIAAVDLDFEHGEDRALRSRQQPTDPAYVIFTSGSTGEPKGVVVAHRGVVNLVHDVNRRFDVTVDDRVLNISALHFDASVYDVFGTIAAGGTLVMPKPYARAEPDLWAELVAREAVTFWNSVPAVLEMVVGHAEVADDAPLGSLRLAVVSGDWIPLTLPDRLRAEAPGVRMIGSGGPTETICWSVFQEIGEVDPRWASIPYGVPITNQRYTIVDSALRQRPVWAVGEMAVSSDIGLAEGYFGDPVQTAERFRVLPETGRRAYLTGDRGRVLPDGTIEILGRTDFQVKINGHRIELGEIEAVLRRQRGIDAAVVLAPRSSRGTRRLVAFVTVCGQVDTTAVREACREVLPRYMVPTDVHVLEQLPLNDNGKVDRNALTERLSGEAPRGAVAVEVSDDAPMTEVRHPVLEQLIAEVYAAILGIDGVQAHDNFFQLGGDSVSGARLARDLHEVLGVPVPTRRVFDNPTVTTLATCLGEDAETGPRTVEAATLFQRLRAEIGA